MRTQKIGMHLDKRTEMLLRVSGWKDKLFGAFVRQGQDGFRKFVQTALERFRPTCAFRCVIVTGCASGACKILCRGAGAAVAKKMPCRAQAAAFLFSRLGLIAEPMNPRIGDSAQVPAESGVSVAPAVSIDSIARGLLAKERAQACQESGELWMCKMRA